MRDKDGIGVTVISHNTENRTKVVGYDDPGSYQRKVAYDGISDVAKQLGVLANASKHCEQYISYQCLDSEITGTY